MNCIDYVAQHYLQSQFCANFIILRHNCEVCGCPAVALQCPAVIRPTALKRPDFRRRHNNVDSNTKSTTLRRVINVDVALTSCARWDRAVRRRTSCFRLLHTINCFFTHYFWIFDWPEYLYLTSSRAGLSASAELPHICRGKLHSILTIL